MPNTSAISPVELLYLNSTKVARISGQDKKISLADKVEQFDQIDLALDRLMLAIRNNDPVKQLEESLSAAVSLFVFLAQLKTQGADLNKAMILTGLSNLSKFPETLEIAQKTVEYYKEEHAMTILPVYNDEYKVYVLMDAEGNFVPPVTFVDNDLKECFPQ